ESARGVLIRRPRQERVPKKTLRLEQSRRRSITRKCCNLARRRSVIRTETETSIHSENIRGNQPMRHRHNLNRRLRRLFAVALCFSLILTPTGLLAQDNKAQKPDQDNRVRKANYELAARWTSQKVGKLVFDTSVTPRWL